MPCSPPTQRFGRRLARMGLAVAAVWMAIPSTAADHREAPILFGGVALESPQEARGLVVTQTLRDFAMAEVEIFGGGGRGARPPGAPGETLEIRVGADAVPLFEGEIVAIEPVFERGSSSSVVVRGYDALHRLSRTRRTRTWPATSDGELVAAMAKRAGLDAVIAGPGFRSAYVLQRNASDLEFLRERAARIGYGLSIDEGALHFAPIPSEPDVRLSFGGSLHSFEPRIGTAARVSRVEVRGWDPTRKEPVVGEAGASDAPPEATALLDRADPSTEAPSLSEGLLFSPEEAALVAAAELAAAAAGGSAVAAGDPRIRAGRVVELAGLGEGFSGRYLVTKATHTISPDGYTTTFEVRRLASSR
jgi:phage protein D